MHNNRAYFQETMHLQAMAKIESSEPGTPSVLFLCVHNAGRSQMAAGWLRALAGDQVNVYTGGSEPGAELNPEVVEVMAESGIDIHEEFPKPWTDEIVRAVDIVIAMGCGDVCPIYPGKRYVDWDLADPAGQDLSTVRAIRDEIRTRVEGAHQRVDLLTHDLNNKLQRLPGEIVDLLHKTGVIAR